MRTVHMLRPLEMGASGFHHVHPEPVLMFPFDGEGSKHVPEGLTALQTQDALQMRRLLEWLLAPPEDLVAIQASLVTGACGGAEDLAAALVQQGYAVKINTSSGGNCHTLQHTFLSIWSAGYGCKGQEILVDPSFADQFAVAHPTPRYAFILSALPRVLVASPRRTLRAIMIIADELASAFKAQGLPLPPWRQLTSLFSKYHATCSVDVLGEGTCMASAQHAGAPGLPGKPAEEELLPSNPKAAGALKEAQQAHHHSVTKLAQRGVGPLEAGRPNRGAAPSPSLPALPPACPRCAVQIGFTVSNPPGRCSGCGTLLAVQPAQRALLRSLLVAQQHQAAEGGAQAAGQRAPCPAPAA